jgi:site-specific DNA recombinase
MQSSPHGAQPALPPRVGIYARFSSDMQRQASIEDQVRSCKECAQSKGWIVDPNYTRSDAGISGATLAARTALKSLISDVEKHRPFDGLVIDDTSRLGRNLGDVLQICAIMKFHDVFLYFVNQGLDSRDPSFYTLMVQYGAGDEQFLMKLRHTVLRGQKGRILAGMIHGGTYYGYRSEVVPDPSRRGTAGRPAIKGVRLVIDPIQAAVVKRIFTLAESGLSFQSIALQCVAENLPLPTSPLNAAETWTPSRIHAILHCELYRGRLIWGKTTGAKNPRTGQIVRKPVPEVEWTVASVPELVIVSSEQWDRVQAVIASHKNFGLYRLGGVGRAKDSHIHLFSGLLVCGVCKGPIVITGNNHKGTRIYQCRNYRYRKTCANKVSILSSVLEQGLIEHVARMCQNPEMLDFTVRQVHQHLKAELALEVEHVQHRQANVSALQQEKRQLDTATTNIINSLREYGPSSVLLQELSRLEARCGAVEKQMAVPLPKSRDVSVQEVREFVQDAAEHLAEALTADRVRAREAIRKHFDPLILTPEYRGRVPIPD